MQKSLWLGGLCGGLTLFVWGAISWMVLPWHLTTLEKFKDEGTVAQAISANAPVHGVYLLPNPHKHDPRLTEDKKKAEEIESLKLMVQGPFMFAAVTPEGGHGMSAALIVQMATDLIAAFLATWLLLRTRGLTFGQRVGFLVAVAVIVFMSAHVHYWNWWRFPTGYTAVSFADLLISWSLAGLVIAQLTARIGAEA